MSFPISPGWADTPAVRSSMPDFYNKMKDRLRTVEQVSLYPPYDNTLVQLSIFSGSWHYCLAGPGERASGESHHGRWTIFSGTICTNEWQTRWQWLTYGNLWNHFQDRQPVAKHLPLAFTKSTKEDDEKLMTILDEMSKKFTSGDW
jgi:dehydrogenase/reductase SDR family protein 12